jgi:hypothetical protein
MGGDEAGTDKAHPDFLHRAIPSVATDTPESGRCTGSLSSRKRRRNAGVAFDARGLPIDPGPAISPPVSRFP